MSISCCYAWPVIRGRLSLRQLSASENTRLCGNAPAVHGPPPNMPDGLPVRGVRREGVTEAAGKLQQAGLIHYSRGHIMVPDRPRLEARVCECYAVVKHEFDRLLPSPSDPRASSSSHPSGY